MLCAPLAKPGSIEETINGGTVGDPADGQPADASLSPTTSGNFNVDVTVGGDIFNIAGAYGATYYDDSTNGFVQSLSFTPIISVVSDTSGDPDTISVDLLLNFQDSTPNSTWASDPSDPSTFYSEGIPLSLTAPAGSTISGQVFYDGQGVGLAGPYAPGTYYYTQATPLDFGALDTSNTLSADFNVTAVFAADAPAGAGGGSSTPEPAMAIPCGLGLLLLTYGVRRRNRSRIAL
jgi:hypothetical protein